ncbi:hypothetical protein ACMTAU_22930, partial [Alcaligenes pakistanensis]
MLPQIMDIVKTQIPVFIDSG